MIATQGEASALKKGVVEQGLAPDKALELKMPNNVPGFINVRFAGEAHCCADIRRMNVGS